MKFYVVDKLFIYISKSQSVDDYLQISLLILKIEVPPHMPLPSYMYNYEARTVVGNVVIQKSAK